MNKPSDPKPSDPKPLDIDKDWIKLAELAADLKPTDWQKRFLNEFMTESSPTPPSPPEMEEERAWPLFVLCGHRREGIMFCQRTHVHPNQARIIPSRGCSPLEAREQLRGIRHGEYVVIGSFYDSSHSLDIEDELRRAEIPQRGGVPLQPAPDYAGYDIVAGPADVWISTDGSNWSNVGTSGNRIQFRVGKPRKRLGRRRAT